MSTVFETVIAGVTILVSGQITIKLIVEPILDFRALLGKITQMFLRNQGVILNARADKELEDLIFTLASELIQKRQSILWYKFLSRIYGLPSYSNVLSAAKKLNLIGNLVFAQKEKSNQERIQIYDAMTEIEHYLNVNIQYNK